MDPVAIMTDFEKGLRNALKLQYPNARLLGCWFHFSQALHKRAKKIRGFRNFIKSNENARKLYKKLKNLPLMEENNIILAFALLKAESKSFGNRFDEFMKYVEDQWITKEGPASFCVFLQPDRTNNLLESYNSSITSKIPANGCFFKFVKALRKDEWTKSKDYAIAYDGGVQIYSTTRRKYEEKNKFIKNHQLKLENGTITVQQFMESMLKIDDDDTKLSDNSENTDDSTDDERAIGNLCMICVMNDKSVLLEPCNHLKFCKTCVDTLFNNTNPKCPECDALITGHRFVYM